MNAELNGALQVMFRPFESVQINTWETIALSANTFTILGGLIFYGSPGAAETRAHAAEF